MFLEEDIILEKEIDFLLKKLEHRHQDYLKIIGSQCMGAAVDEEWLSRGVYNHFSGCSSSRSRACPMTTPSRRGSTPASITVGPMTTWEEHCGVLLAGIAAAAARRAAPGAVPGGRPDTNREEEYVTELQMRVE